MVTHDQEEALTMADRIVVMNHGVIDQVGTPEEIYSSPATSFVADFIGSMNFVPGVVSGVDEVSIGDVRLSCDIDGAAQGDRITVAIRPEDVNAQDMEHTDNTIDVEVRQLKFMGSFYRAALASTAFSDHDIEAEFSVNLVRRKGLAAGSKLPIRMPGERIVVYPRTVD